jgi:hypothetical protein
MTNSFTRSYLGVVKNDHSQTSASNDEIAQT